MEGELLLEHVREYVGENIGKFHRKKLDRLVKLRLKTILKKKNPYLFRAKHLENVNDLVRSILDAYISSSEETIFGDWLEELAIYVNQMVYQGKKSSAKGIDLEFEKEDITFLVSIKSGPNWGNSSQMKKLEADFKSTIRTLRTSNNKIHVKAINGCCYGQKYSDKGIYQMICGQRFWELISGDSELYAEIIQPLGFESKERNAEFQSEFDKLTNRFNREFMTDFCYADGQIDWESLVRFNSSRT